MTDFETKDSGERQQFDSGMQRDTEKGKPRFDLLVPKDVPYDEQLLTRFAKLLGRGAEKYTERNWEQADSQAEIERARSSAFRHFFQWLTGETDEDHAAAVLFNIMVVETITRKLERQAEEPVGETLTLSLAGIDPQTLALIFGGVAGVPQDEVSTEGFVDIGVTTHFEVSEDGVGQAISQSLDRVFNRGGYFPAGVERTTEDLRM